MADLKIEDATPDTAVGGNELIPVSDAGIPKSVTTEKLKDFVLAKIAALSGASDVGVTVDSVYLKQGGELKPVPASVFADAVIASAFGKDAAAEIGGTEKIALNNGTVSMTVTVDALAAWLKNKLNPPALDMSRMSVLGGVDENANFAAEADGETGKISLSALMDFILRIGADRFVDLNQEGVSKAEDMVLLMRKGEDGYPSVTRTEVERLPFGQGDVKGPAVQVDGGIPVWSGASGKTLSGGMAVVKSVTAESQDTQVPTAAAVEKRFGRSLSLPNGAFQYKEIPGFVPGRNLKEVAPAYRVEKSSDTDPTGLTTANKVSAMISEALVEKAGFVSRIWAPKSESEELDPPTVSGEIVLVDDPYHTPSTYLLVSTVFDHELVWKKVIFAD